MEREGNLLVSLPTRGCSDMGLSCWAPAIYLTTVRHIGLFPSKPGGKPKTTASRLETPYENRFTHYLLSSLS